MWVVLTHDFTDCPCRLLMWAVWRNASLTHCVQNTAVNRLKTVSNIWKCTSNNNGHGILKEGSLHL